MTARTNGQPVNARGILRRCFMDQGPEGHFGVEWFDGPMFLIDGGEYRGGEVLISPGRSHGLKVLGAKLHLGGRTHSAVEIAVVNDAEVAGCVADSTDAYSGALAWVTNGSARCNVHGNSVANMYAVVNPDNRPGYVPTALRVTDNAGTFTKYVVGPPVPADAIVTGNAVSA